MISDRWLHVSNIQPVLSGRLRILPKEIRGELWYFIQDPLTNEHTRLRSDAWSFISRLAGRSVGEAWTDAYLAGEAGTLTQSEVISLITGLYRRNLISLAVPADSARLAERGQRRNRKPFLQKAQSVMFMTLPLVDPDRALRAAAPLIRFILGPFGLLAWLVAVFAALEVLASQWGRVANASAAVFAAPDPLSLFLAFLLGKTLHELGHAAMCRRFGQPVHAMGVMLLVFAPLPYVDVSAAWAMRSKAQRIAVGSAGMLVDIFVGALATLAWAQTPPGPINDALFSLMLTSATYTVLFNANPLMRFDGYYILSDLLELPNMAARASAALGQVVTRHLLGERPSTEDEMTTKPHFGLAAFGALTLVYRVFAIGGIILFLADMYYGAGLLGALLLALGALIIPLTRSLSKLRDGEMRGRRPPGRLWLLGGALGAILGFIALVPLPDWVSLPASIEAIGATQVSATTEGWLEEVVATPNTIQRSGQALLRLVDPQLLLERRGIQQQLIGNALMERRALSEGGANLEPIRERGRALEALLRQSEIDIAGLTIRAVRDGFWVAPDLRRHQHGWIERGTELGTLLPGEGFRMVAIVSQSASALLARHSVPVAELRCAGTAGMVLPVEELRLVPQALGRLSNPALGSAMGGEVAVSGHDASGTTSAEPIFRLDGLIRSDAAWLHHHRVCSARVWLPARSLGARWAEGLRQFIQRRYRL